MEKWVARVAMVTGASKFLGLAIVEILANHGMTVVAVDDDNPEFQKVEELVESLKAGGAAGEVVASKCDIRNHDNVKKLFGSVKADPDLEGVDVCVHCAVHTVGEAILDGNPEAWRAMLELNVLAAAMVSQETYKSMKERSVDDGHIIFINGMNSHRLMPGNKNMHFLGITRHATRAMLEAIRNELRMEDSHIRVSALSPGVIETDVIMKLFDGDAESAQSFLAEKKYLTVEDVAKVVCFTLEQPPHVQIHDILMRSTDQIP